MFTLCNGPGSATGRKRSQALLMTLQRVPAGEKDHKALKETFGGDGDAC